MTREQERQELYKTIWSIANDLRGSVDGWDFKAYVLGMLAYRYLSESLAGELNRGEREAGATDFDYARQDECLEGQDRLNFVQNRGYYIEPGLLFENVMQADDSCLNEKLDAALRQIEASGEGTGAAKMFEGLFTDMDLNSNKLGAGTEERNRRLKKLMASIGSLKLGTYMTDRVGSIGREAGKDMGLSGSVISADALAAIQSAVDASVAMRKKKRLLELFLSQVNNGGDASGDAFLALASEAYDKAVRDAIADLKLRDEAVDFIKRCVESGCVLETGSGLDAILPPVRRFGGGGPGIIREQVVEKIQVIVDEFEGLDVKS